MSADVIGNDTRMVCGPCSNFSGPRMTLVTDFTLNRTRTVNSRLFNGSLFQFNTVTAAPTLEQSIGVSTIGSEASTGTWIPASLTGATIQFRITAEKFHGNFRLHRWMISRTKPRAAT